MTRTKIEWADYVWNPVRGCSMAPGSEKKGCLNCYAARMAARGLPGMRDSEGNPLAVMRDSGPRWTVMRDSGPRWTGKVELVESKIRDPRRFRKTAQNFRAAHGRKPRVFVNSMSDLLHESLPLHGMAAVLEAMAEAPWFDFLVLTKRHYRLAWLHGDPIPHVRLGVSAEDQATLDLRAPALMEMAANGWKNMLSLEPLLGPVEDLERWLEPVGMDSCNHCGEPERHYMDGSERDHVPWTEYGDSRCPECNALRDTTGYDRGIDWVIVGSESGPSSRPLNEDWVRSIRDQCADAGVPFFYKQKLDEHGRKIGTPRLDGKTHAEVPR